MHPLEKYFPDSLVTASLSLDNPDDIKKLSLQLNQFLKQKGLTQSKQSLLLEGISHALGFNTWNSCQGTLKNREKNNLNLDTIVWDVHWHNYHYNYQHQVLKITFGDSLCETSHYFFLSVNTIEKIITDLGYLEVWDNMGRLPVNNQPHLTDYGNLRYGVMVEHEQSKPWFVLEQHLTPSECGLGNSTSRIVIKKDFEKATQPFLAIIQNRPGSGKPRDMSALKSLNKLSELLAFMQADPLDRILWHSDDLGPNDWDSGYSTRNDTACLVVMSMKALNVKNIDEMAQVTRGHDYHNGVRPGEIAVIGDEKIRDSSGRKTPKDIDKMIRDTENGVTPLPLSGCLYEGVWMLSSHPEARSFEQIEEAILNQSSNNNTDD